MELAEVLHCLAQVHSEKVHPDPSARDARHREGLAGYFTSTHAVDKFCDVVQAFVAMCTSSTGPDNVALMIGLSSANIYFYVCQNGGPPAAQVSAHILNLWGILQKVCGIIILPKTKEQVTPPRTKTGTETTLITELSDAAHCFLARKAIYRARKKVFAITSLVKQQEKNIPEDSFERTILIALLSTAKAADLISRETANPTKAGKWRVFRNSIYELNLKKYIEKVLKVEAAAFTLSNFAVSYRSRYLANLNPVVRHTPLPPKGSVDLEIDKLQRCRPRMIESDDFLAKVIKGTPRSTTTCTSVTTKTHSECEFVARVLANGSTENSPGFHVIPYVASSKLHCLACDAWLEAFNEQAPEVPICYDGSHGELDSGWEPPTVVPPEVHEQIVNTMRDNLAQKLQAAKHQKESSASSTSSDPPVVEAVARPDEEMQNMLRDEGLPLFHRA
ncbi:hypothetical protein B0H17DRAFT_1089584 [Mycena rosella]|uniref:Uncharacterized protein n=1 Tax=Mycena rosella TaxID=1033263 RepID=A0AAD7CW93_MYCRO|nr:hypothetical protein B0H17DRAFT_1089584 [Mycena rosella]